MGLYAMKLLITMGDLNVMLRTMNGLYNSPDSHRLSSYYVLDTLQIEFCLISQKSSLVGVIPFFPVGKP